MPAGSQTKRICDSNVHLDVSCFLLAKLARQEEEGEGGWLGVGLGGQN